MSYLIQFAAHLEAPRARIRVRGSEAMARTIARDVAWASGLSVHVLEGGTFRYVTTFKRVGASVRELTDRARV